MTLGYRALFDLVLTRLSPERAHAAAFTALDAVTSRPRVRALLRRYTHLEDELIRVSAFGLTFPSPLGVAAGLDKDAEHFEGLAALGFGFVEVGTLTPQPQESNPRPILARVTRDRALLNRMGFPNKGAEAAARRLAERNSAVIVGANVGKNRATAIEHAASDYAAAAAAVAPHADYLVLNVSSPNTPGLRDLQGVGNLRPLIEAVLAVVQRPVLVKISPDISDGDVDAVADLALELGLDGIVATNTTLQRTDLLTPADEVARLAWADGGGVSGAPLKARSLAVLSRLRARVGDRLVLISVGGIESADDVWERVLAGATLVQVYTGFIYGGPGWPRAVNLELARRTWDAGRRSIQELVGTGGTAVGSDQ
ncbi:MAG TPA: quinone-dependent dihydroorotate dehydrogenase [Solirubrobacteraceae bacterium]|nr:quinone-dependent dihydroorotate dehydrogenase [Solirubrobacteraceae bacterium]